MCYNSLMQHTWDQISDIILYAAIAVLGVLCVMGLLQLIRGKSIKSVDKSLLALPLPLALAAAVYVIFDKFVILNVRPNGSGEPSFPSSHVLLVATVFFCTAILLPRFIRSRAAYISLDILMLILLVTVCVGRILANMHWLSDVLGALGFAAIFTLIYYLIIRSKNADPVHEDH